MTAYGLAHLHDPNPNEDVIDDIDRIQAAMDPFGGRFLADGAATAWYGSTDYQAILPRRSVSPLASR